MARVVHHRPDGSQRVGQEVARLGAAARFIGVDLPDARHAEHVGRAGGIVAGDPTGGFVTKLDSIGQWVSGMGFPAGGPAGAVGVHALAVDGAGNIGVAGQFNGSTAIGANTFSSQGVGLLAFTLSP